jgi:L-methionine (R)-S-oxide reductase
MAEHTTTQHWLQGFLAAHGGVAGSVHALGADGALHLAASVNLPPPVVAAVATVPRGKGMAGLALERGRPVQTCNLQTDGTGDVRPGARAVNAQAAVALPIRDAAGGVRAVVGIAFAHERELPEDDVARLGRDAAAVPVDAI